MPRAFDSAETPDPRSAHLPESSRIPGASSFAKQIGPDLRFQNHHDRRTQAPQHAAHAPYIIERGEEHAIHQTGESLCRCFPSGQRGCAEENRRPGRAFPDLFDQPESPPEPPRRRPHGTRWKPKQSVATMEKSCRSARQASRNMPAFAVRAKADKLGESVKQASGKRGRGGKSLCVSMV